MKKQGWCKMIPKYRGLSIDEDSKGKWKYGYLIEDNEQSFIINEVVEANEQYITIGSWYPVRPDTASQSTGLHDKDGNEIFEGDILGIETDTGIVYVNVYWDTEHALFMIKSEEYNNEEALAEIFEDYTYPFMVVGNILEEKK